MDPKLWWYVARATGITAWALAAVSVIWGLALSTRVLGKKPNGPWLLDLHRFVGGLSVVFVGLHLVGLVGDSYSHFGVADLLVPFASSWKPGAVALGVVALYLLVAIEVTSLLMKRIPKRVWRAVHFSSAGVYVLGTAHLLLAGTDASNRLLLAAVWLTSAVATFLLAVRILWARTATAPAQTERPSRPTLVA